MLEVRFHGRGGQGAVIASEILARAAMKEGKYASAFPFFGVERRGAPVMAFCRIDDRPIRIHAGIYGPDHVVVLDHGLMKMVNVQEGQKEGGSLVVNTSMTLDELGLPADRRTLLIDATTIALRRGLGSATAPIVNTAILGAFARACDIVSIDSILESIKESVPAKRDQNVAAAQDAYRSLEGM
ncbi:MAG: 2-oxoacid:acceptor oxidoreductase family protein [Methanomassiliicoccus sp.]|nr:2-oxoacid:acceptor oxidoreductase family protein [Methanomassiliicoccus sp.]